MREVFSTPAAVGDQLKEGGLVAKHPLHLLLAEKIPILAVGAWLAALSGKEDPRSTFKLRNRLHNHPVELTLRTGFVEYTGCGRFLGSSCSM